MDREGADEVNRIAKWSEQEVALLRARYADEPTSTIAAALGKSIRACEAMAFRLGVGKSADHRRVVALKNGANMPGWNRGKRGACASGTWKPIGSERLNKAGLLERKVSDGNGKDDWQTVHRYVWESVNGPAPSGYLVVFKPGMRTNIASEITVDKLELVTRSELILRNGIQQYPKEIQRAYQLLGALTKEIQKRSKA